MLYLFAFLASTVLLSNNEINAGLKLVLLYMNIYMHAMLLRLIRDSCSLIIFNNPFVVSEYVKYHLKGTPCPWEPVWKCYQHLKDS